ncbi:helix-turn-helix transcriptional regulator [Ligilactobacillus animalis]|uniref:helix-turn-helix domain-containing protein n=1 Tax=Ligilactobacillus animalis TaxID=1605 RepID=UPI0029024CD6|nr:helix-turn-helix transcriptional regulator [Ligilactobacillus animalis]MDU1488410.1 helix-turn-helix transcriptional regulator [Ligilactobacillus animalis]
MRWNKVEKLLQQRQKTIYWLSKQTGISVSSLYYLRDGKLKKPSFELMCKIADALGVSLDYFRETEDNK